MTFRVKITHNQLLELGYIYRPRAKDYLKSFGDGRFHAKPEGEMFRIHYDFSKNHITNIPMPHTLGQEQGRIRKYINSSINPKKRSIQL